MRKNMRPPAAVGLAKEPSPSCDTPSSLKVSAAPNAATALTSVYFSPVTPIRHRSVKRACHIAQIFSRIDGQPSTNHLDHLPRHHRGSVHFHHHMHMIRHHRKSSHFSRKTRRHQTQPIFDPYFAMLKLITCQNARRTQREVACTHVGNIGSI